MRINRWSTAIACVALLATGFAAAHEGHDDAPPAVASAGGAPRVEAHSDLFELVGIVEHGAMTLYLDRYTDNAPIKDAKIEVEAGKEKGIATPNPDGSYLFKSALFVKPAPMSMTFTVTAGKDADLLAGDLAVSTAAAAHPHDGLAISSRTTAIGIAIAAILLALAAIPALRMRRRKQGL